MVQTGQSVRIVSRGLPEQPELPVLFGGFMSGATLTLLSGGILMLDNIALNYGLVIIGAHIDLRGNIELHDYTLFETIELYADASVQLINK